jgi:hypothetical protein
LAAAPAVAGSLILGIVSTPVATFTQDSVHASYATPPNRIASGASGTDVVVAGGTVVSSSQLTYAPTLGSSVAWAEIVVAFKPAFTAPTSVFSDSGGAFEGSLTARSGNDQQRTVWWS